MLKKHKGFVVADILIPVTIGFAAVLLIFGIVFAASVYPPVPEREYTLTLYDYSGTPMRQWRGYFALYTGNSETHFELNGRQIKIRGGIIVCEEVK